MIVHEQHADRGLFVFIQGSLGRRAANVSKVPGEGVLRMTPSCPLAGHNITTAVGTVLLGGQRAVVLYTPEEEAHFRELGCPYYGGSSPPIRCVRSEAP